MRALVWAALHETCSLSIPLARLSDHDDLFEAGLTSFDLINLITYLEEQGGFEFPGEAMTRENFSSLEQICFVIESIREKGIS